MTNSERNSNTIDPIIVEFFGEIGKRTISSWPKDCHLGNPFAFPWYDELVREQFIHLMATDLNGKTNHPAKDLLRFLLFRFRVAQVRRDNPPEPFKGHRWVWHKNGYVQRWTGLSDYQLRTAVAFLRDRGLVIQDYDPAVSNCCPHYRPTNDLFRVAHTLCFWTNIQFVGALNGYTPMEQHREQMQEVINDHYDDLSDALLEFANSDSRGRARRFFNRFMDLIDHVLGSDQDEAA